MRFALESVGVDWLRLELWDGAVVCGGPDAPVGVHIGSRRTLLRILRNPSLGFGEGYSDGSVRVHGDLCDFLVRIFRCLQTRREKAVSRVWNLLAGRPRRNTVQQASENIHSHYDLGNDFYSMWLDEQMVYTCAYYPGADASLAEAQRNKMDHVCRKLALEPGQHVLELGCGWGSLALHMAEHYGVEVTACNISREQLDYARGEARRRGLEARVRFVEQDYRNAAGTFDRLVSVGMLEHVGVEHYGDLAAVIARCLSPQGLGLLHSIGRSQPCRMDPWIERRIFPGAHPPTLSEMDGIFAPYRLAVLDVENLRMHYARTCRDWRQRFEACFEQVCQRFDARFARAWRLYLAGSEAAFVSGNLQLFQVVFAPAHNNEVPWTRAYVYPGVGEQRPGA